ncbi:iron-containing redox enzyme family protein [Pseudomonas sp. CDFA 602]|uniref:iron-containing redox enzyme family protein n=1 Tax=Pseudomonas californiensis TaxID=2829823 RepID=UPI001E2FB4F1|nr:iron-containing redox enzyme family protein [Pseudomonas californiensis]MCD5995446.1 iron-containing redox enzyme family protein [Pseudomonas californiensis]MCD6000958.1 iron-containing redox enzyme family protein [Pseudomonas californiensis]
MTSLQLMTGNAVVKPVVEEARSRNLYQSWMSEGSADPHQDAVAFLNQCLALADHEPCELPAQPDALEQWIEHNVGHVADQYAVYLEQRRAGQPRRFFKSKAHAMYFLQHVAPTKLVDGAWLYGLLPHWADYRFHGLIRTYLEELGDGEQAQNHVSLYRKLLADLDCDTSAPLHDDAYLQGAIQLSLGQMSDQFLPEVIGYNLGYEQLPLHLLITSFELNELGIDPYYFTLHVTIDNASTGHARKAAQSVMELLPVGEEREAFYRRVISGYKLNELGIGSSAVIQSFDLEQEVVAMLERKRTFGQHMHSDYCRLDGKTVNEWLARPDQIPEFLEVLQNRGWIKRHQDPVHSRFWQLFEGAGAPMFGVFNGYEKQLVHDWIAGDWLADGSAQTTAGKRLPEAFRSRFRNLPNAQPSAVPGAHAAKDFDPDLRELHRKLESATATEKMAILIESMSPARHASAAGLYATRLFVTTMAERLTGVHA